MGALTSMNTPTLMIAKVHADDVASARAHIERARREASSAWIPANAIADALLLEWIEQSGQLVDRRALLARIDALLHALETRNRMDRRKPN